MGGKYTVMEEAAGSVIRKDALQRAQEEETDAVHRAAGPGAGISKQRGDDSDHPLGQGQPEDPGGANGGTWKQESTFQEGKDVRSPRFWM